MTPGGKCQDTDNVRCEREPRNITIQEKLFFFWQAVALISWVLKLFKLVVKNLIKFTLISNETPHNCANWSLSKNCHQSLDGAGHTTWGLILFN